MKRTSKIFFAALLITLFASCALPLKPPPGPYLRMVCEIDGEEYEYLQNQSYNHFYNNTDPWGVVFSRDSIAHFCFQAFNCLMLISSDTSFFVDGKRYYYSWNDMLNYPERYYFRTWLPGLLYKSFYSGSFQFNVLEWNDSTDDYYGESRIDYYVQFDTRWADKEDSDTVIFNGRIDAFAKLRNEYTIQRYYNVIKRP